VSRRDDNYHANQQALQFWASGANGRAAASYLRRRGINVAALPDPYRIGYARPGWTSLVDHLAPSRQATALAAGLIVATNDGRLVDRFRDRVMFPIREPDGRIAGFIGRRLSTDPTAPKYLNTPATDTFTKAALFNGLREAGQAGGLRPVLVEGPLDALAIAATAHATRSRDLLPIATCSTALSPAHATQLAAWCRHHNVDPLIAYDPDPPGRAAALRAGELLRDHGLKAHIAAPNAGLDPADHLAITADLSPYRAHPAGTAIPLAAAVTELIITEHHGRSNPDWPETKLRIAHQISRHLTGYSDPLLPEAAGAACNIAARRAGIHPDTLLHAITARRPRIDVDVPGGARVIGGRAL
jgi:DNA primase catalytic core